MKKTSLELRSIVSAGGCVVINANDYSTLEMKTIAACTNNNGGQLILQHAVRLSSLECRSIASAGKSGGVMFVFTD